MVVAAIRVSRWFCRRNDDLLLRSWSDGCVLFDEAQGQLHCLTSASGEVMSLLLQRREWTSFELAEVLIGEAPTEDDVVMVENTALHFLSLNLIHRLQA